MVRNMFMSFTRYDLSRVGRHRMNLRFKNRLRTRWGKSNTQIGRLDRRLARNHTSQQHAGAEGQYRSPWQSQSKKTLGELLQDKPSDAAFTHGTHDQGPHEHPRCHHACSGTPHQFTTNCGGNQRIFSSGQLSQFMDQNQSAC